MAEAGFARLRGMSPFTFRAPTAADDPAFERARGLAYGGRVAREAPDPLVAGVREHERSLIALDGDDLVATSLGYGFDMSVPGIGRSAAVAGFAGISVVPTHRRRGLLREIMRRSLDAAHERREALSVLWPSESPIYRRFGYGAATTYLRWSLPRHRARLLDVEVEDRTVRILSPDPAKVAAAVAPVHDAVRNRRPGMLARSPQWWARRTARAATDQVWVLVEGPDGADGYAAYVVQPSWGSSGPENLLSVTELAATTAAAEVALWRHLVGVDLVTTLSGWGLAPDSPLPHLLADTRALDRSLADGAWLRIVDLPAALSARAYPIEADLVVAVSDAFCPWNAGHWHLRAAAGGEATCVPADRAPDVSLDVAELGAAYLGDVPLTTLAAAGLVREHTPGAVAALGAALVWRPAAWAVTWF